MPGYRRSRATSASSAGGSATAPRAPPRRPASLMLISTPAEPSGAAFGLVKASNPLADAFTALCAGLSPAWGCAGHAGEYWAKVMSDQPRIEAVGRDFGRYLPGVFWLNFFGSRCQEFIGLDRLRSAPADRVAPVDGGTLVGLGADPAGWDTAEYAIAEQRVRDHLGAELFFSKAEPQRRTKVPGFGG